MAAPAQAGKPMEVSIQDDGVFLGGDYFSQDLAFLRARALGVTHVRMNILWWQPIPSAQRLQTTVPSNIQYDFSAWDAAVNRARDFGIEVQLDLTGDPPAFACGNKQPPYACDGFRPDVNLFAHFVAATVAHFRGRVTRFSMWNEPNWYTWISPHDESPLIYRQLYQAGYTAAKGANPDAEVVLGEFAPHFQRNISMPPLEFIRRMVCVKDNLRPIRDADEKCPGGPLKLDAVATHPYDFTNRPTRRRKDPDELTIANINELSRLLNRLRKKGLIEPSIKKIPIYLTEHGYFVAGRRGVPENRRSRWIVQAWQMALDAPRVKQMLHYVLVSPPTDSPSAYFDMGLIGTNGALRPSYNALRGWTSSHAESLVRPGPCSAC